MTVFVIQNLIKLDLIKMHHDEDPYLYIYNQASTFIEHCGMYYTIQKIHTRMTITGNFTGRYACT